MGKNLMENGNNIQLRKKRIAFSQTKRVFHTV